MADIRIDNLSTPAIGPLMPPAATPDSAPASGKDFKTYLIDSLNKVSQLQDEADAGVQKLATGQTDNLAEVFSATRKAGVAFDLLMEIRNKLMDAYTELKQMRV